jgi:hypothetical protein
VELEEGGMDGGLRMEVALALGVTLTGEALEITPTEATVDEDEDEGAAVVAAAAVVVAATEAAVVVESEEEAAPVNRAGPGMV